MGSADRHFSTANRHICCQPGRFLLARAAFQRAALCEADDWAGPAGALQALYLEWCRGHDRRWMATLADEAARLRALIPRESLRQGAYRDMNARNMVLLTRVVEADLLLSRSETAGAARRAKACLERALRRPRYWDCPDIRSLALFQLAQAECRLGEMAIGQFHLHQAVAAIGKVPADEQCQLESVAGGWRPASFRAFCAGIRRLRRGCAGESASAAVDRLGRYGDATGRRSSLPLGFRKVALPRLQQAWRRCGMAAPPTYLDFVHRHGLWSCEGSPMLSVPRLAATLADRELLELWKDAGQSALAGELVGFQQHDGPRRLFCFRLGDPTGRVYHVDDADVIHGYRYGFDRHMSILVNTVIDRDLER